MEECGQRRPGEKTLCILRMGINPQLRRKLVGTERGMDSDEATERARGQITLAWSPHSGSEALIPLVTESIQLFSFM